MASSQASREWGPWWFPIWPACPECPGIQVILTLLYLAKLFRLFVVSLTSHDDTVQLDSAFSAAWLSVQILITSSFTLASRRWSAHFMMATSSAWNTVLKLSNLMDVSLALLGPQKPVPTPSAVLEPSVNQILKILML